MENHAPIISFDEMPPAEAVMFALREKGIGAYTISESSEQMLRMLNFHPRAHCRVWVQENDMEKASQYLEGELSSLTSLAARCPDCGSYLVEFPQFSRNTIVGTLPVAAAAALGIVSREYYCSACHFTWPPDDAKDAG